MRFALAIITGLALIFFVVIAALVPPVVPVPPKQDRVISYVTVLNPGKPLLPNQTIEIRGGVITAIRPAIASDPAPMCEGCIVMPGLIDSHVHFPPALLPGNQEIFALMYLAHGVTSVRDVGQADGSVPDLAARLNAGELAGPHMYRCGPVLEGDPPAWPTARVLRNKAEATQAVAELATSGVDCLKIYNEVSAEVYAGVVEAAARHGLPVIGHVPHKVGLKNVRDFEAQHMTGLPYVLRPRPAIGMDIAAEDVLAMEAGETRAALALALKNNVSFTPTLANFKLRLSAADPTRFPPPQALAHLPAFWGQGFKLVAGYPKTDAEIAVQQQVLPALKAQVRMAHEMGVPILAGTDTLMPFVLPGDALWRELDELADALESPEVALIAATAINGQAIAAGRIGVIQGGARADLLMLGDDPRQDLTALKNWRFVMTDGRLYSRADVVAGLAAFKAHFAGAFYRTLMDGMIGLVADLYQSANAADQAQDPLKH